MRAFREEHAFETVLPWLWILSSGTELSGHLDVAERYQVTVMKTYQESCPKPPRGGRIGMTKKLADSCELGVEANPEKFYLG
jgi:hypothetical protein